MQTNQKNLVLEIHTAFDTAADRLLAEAKEIIAVKPKAKSAVNAEKLRKLGFGSSAPAMEVEKLAVKKLEMNALINDISHFQHHYPFHKFITEKEVEKICAKYGLVLGNAGQYIGDIPEKNIEEIEKFILRQEDYVHETINMSWREALIQMERDRQSLFMDLGMFPGSLRNTVRSSEPVKVKEKPAFKIVAPQKDFDMRGQKLEDYKLVDIPDVHDPIVLQPVKNGYLVVSKWGLEASDEILVNSVDN